jgi:hypothetical protein
VWGFIHVTYDHRGFVGMRGYSFLIEKGKVAESDGWGLADLLIRAMHASSSY